MPAVLIRFPLLWKDTMTRQLLQRTAFKWGWLTGSEVTPLSSRQEPWQHPGRHGAAEGAESSPSWSSGSSRRLGATLGVPWAWLQSRLITELKPQTTAWLTILYPYLAFIHWTEQPTWPCVKSDRELTLWLGHLNGDYGRGDEGAGSWQMKGNILEYTGYSHKTSLRLKSKIRLKRKHFWKPDSLFSTTWICSKTSLELLWGFPLCS